MLVSTTAGGGNGPSNATFQGTSADGSAAFFETGEALALPDTDSGGDVYRRSSGATVLVSTGPEDGNAGASASFGKTSPDGSTAVFTTAEQLTVEDTDISRDVYSRDIGAGSTALVSRAGAGCTGTCGTGSVDAGFAGASTDGSAVFFETTESLVAADADTSADIYQRSGGETTLVSTGPMARNGASNPHLADVSQDGDHALFTTEERLTIDDLDTEPDVYDRSAAGTLLVSTRNPDELVLGPAAPFLTGTNPGSPNPSTEPRVLGQADLGTSIKVYGVHGASAELAPALLEAGVKVIDLAGDFRLPASAYPDWYGFEHPAADWLGKAVYGLPELFGDQLPARSSWRTRVLPDAGDPRPGAAAVRGARRAGADPRRRQDRACRAPGRAGARPRRSRPPKRACVPTVYPRHQHTPEMERAWSSRPASHRRSCSCPTSSPRSAASSRRRTRGSPRA